jgi:hypothetical protein
MHSVSLHIINGIDLGALRATLNSVSTAFASLAGGGGGGGSGGFLVFLALSEYVKPPVTV